MFIHPSRETRYSTVCSKPKGEYLHPRYLHTKFSQYDNNSRVPTCLRVQCTFSASVPVLTTTSVPGFTKTNCNDPSNESHTWPACETKQLSKFQSKHENRLTTKVSCFVSSSDQNNFHFLHSPGRLHWLNTCSAQTLPQLQLKTTDATWCIWEIKTNIPKQAVSTCYLSINPLSTNSLNTKFHRAFSAMTVLTSLSLSTPVPILPGKNHTASGFSFKVTSANVRQAPLFLHTTEPQVFSYSRLISKLHKLLISHMWQSNSLMNQGHWQSKNLTLQALMPQFLFLTTTSRHDARLSSTTHCALRASRINYNLTNLSRCNSFSQYFSNFLLTLSSDSPGSLSAKITTLSSDSPGFRCQNHQAFHNKL